MADKKPMIVIKKITVSGGGHHGGAWKVAFADFMTAMMAFFLVMWLLGQSEQTKKAISDYFSTPSVIEYNFQNFGAEITLEKLFLDLVNEPMKAFQDFMEPVDKTPNLMDMSSTKVVAAYLADQLRDDAKKVTVNSDGFEFVIPDNVLFENISATPTKGSLKIFSKLKGILAGLKDVNIEVSVALFTQASPEKNYESAVMLATERMALVRGEIQGSLEHSSASVKGSVQVKEKKGEVEENEKLLGLITIRVKQKEFTSEGKKTRLLDSFTGASEVQKETYDEILQKVEEQDLKQKKKLEELNLIDPGDKIETGLPEPLEENSVEEQKE